MVGPLPRRRPEPRRRRGGRASQVGDALLIAEHGHDFRPDLGVRGWHGVMNYSGFLRPLWTWLLRDDPEPEQQQQFWGIAVGVPQLGGEAAVDALRAFRAGVPWEAVLNSWNLLDSHDTARFRHDRRLARAASRRRRPADDAAGRADGVRGRRARSRGRLGRGRAADDAVGRRTWDESFLGAFRELIHLRRTLPALARGGIRWVHVDADTIAFVRESRDERLLCVASRAADRRAVPGAVHTASTSCSDSPSIPALEDWSTMADVAFDNVDKVYDNGVQAVFDLTLGINDGEFLVLVGPSGCGKTTALRMVAGLEDISDGTLSIGGRVVNDVTPKERDIAMVFQNYALYPHLSVAENIAFGLRLRKTDKAHHQRAGRRGPPRCST